MKHDGHTVLLTTHDLDEAEALCDRIAIIDHGRIIATGTPRELAARSRAVQSVTLVTVTPLDAGRCAALAGVRDLTADGTTLRFTTTSASRTLADLMALLDTTGTELLELRVRKASLEDVFIELTASAGDEVRA